jgi:nitrogen regulatory protein P-II 1
MKRIDAIIPEKKLNAVNTALHEINVTGLTVFDTKGRGKGTPKPDQLGHWLYYTEFGENITLMILSSDSDAEKIVGVIQSNASLGKIFVTNVEELIDIQKNTKGNEAL